MLIVTIRERRPFIRKDGSQSKRYEVVTRIDAMDLREALEKVKDEFKAGMPEQCGIAIMHKRPKA